MPFAISEKQMAHINKERDLINKILDYKPSNPFESFRLKIKLEVFNMLVELHNAEVRK